MKIKIIVAAHKPYQMPKDDIYLPLHVGHAGKPDIGFQGDDTGENISTKNANYCELTGLYWAWKNLDADYLGLVHYRRLFSIKKNKDINKSILTREQLEPILKKSDVVLPKKRKYYIETIYSHYSHTFYASHLDKTRDIISRICPEYIPAFNRVMGSTQAHMFNMFIMKRELADRYCKWLFNILFQLEKEIDISKLNDFEARLFGRISEVLLDVWIIANSISYTEVNFIYKESIDWKKKIASFFSAKFLGRKYTRSF
jgi:hypothetical protein